MCWVFTSSIFFIWEHFIILEKENSVKHTFRKADYQFQRTEKHPHGSCSREQPNEIGAATNTGYSQGQQAAIMTQYVMQPTGSDTILSLVPGNGPGMTKKIIIL